MLPLLTPSTGSRQTVKSRPGRKTGAGTKPGRTLVSWCRLAPNQPTTTSLDHAGEPSGGPLARPQQWELGRANGERRRSCSSMTLRSVPRSEMNSRHSCRLNRARGGRIRRRHANVQLLRQQPWMHYNRPPPKLQHAFSSKRWKLPAPLPNMQQRMMPDRQPCPRSRLQQRGAGAATVSLTPRL